MIESDRGSLLPCIAGSGRVHAELDCRIAVPGEKSVFLCPTSIGLRLKRRIIHKKTQSTEEIVPHGRSLNLYIPS